MDVGGGGVWSTTPHSKAFSPVLPTGRKEYSLSVNPSSSA